MVWLNLKSEVENEISQLIEWALSPERCNCILSIATIVYTVQVRVEVWPNEIWRREQSLERTAALCCLWRSTGESSHLVQRADYFYPINLKWQLTVKLRLSMRGKANHTEKLFLITHKDGITDKRRSDKGRSDRWPSLIAGVERGVLFLSKPDHPWGHQHCQICCT